MQKHLEFQVVTPRTLTEFKGDTLVLPDVRILSDAEKSWLQQYVAGGGKLIITGVDATQFPSASIVVRIQPCPGKQYMAALESDFEHTSPDSQAAFLQNLDGGYGRFRLKLLLRWPLPSPLWRGIRMSSWRISQDCGAE